MKPHLNHINNTMIKKQLANEAGNDQKAYLEYQKKIIECRNMGISDLAIIGELEAELIRIHNDHRKGDKIFQQGVVNAKNATMKAIRRILKEMKGEEI